MIMGKAAPTSGKLRWIMEDGAVAGPGGRPPGSLAPSGAVDGREDGAHGGAHGVGVDAYAP